LLFLHEGFIFKIEREADTVAEEEKQRSAEIEGPGPPSGRRR